MPELINFIEGLAAYGAICGLPIEILGSLTLIALGLKGITANKETNGWIGLLLLLLGVVALFVGIDALFTYVSKYFPG